MFCDSLLAFVVVVVVDRIQKSFYLCFTYAFTYEYCGLLSMWLRSCNVYMFLLSAWNMATE